MALTPEITALSFSSVTLTVTRMESAGAGGVGGVDGDHVDGLGLVVELLRRGNLAGGPIDLEGSGVGPVQGVEEQVGVVPP